MSRSPSVIIGMHTMKRIEVGPTCRYRLVSVNRWSANEKVSRRTRSSRLDTAYYVFRRVVVRDFNGSLGEFPRPDLFPIRDGLVTVLTNTPRRICDSANFYGGVFCIVVNRASSTVSCLRVICTESASPMANRWKLSLGIR